MRAACRLRVEMDLRAELIVGKAPSLPRRLTRKMAGSFFPSPLFSGFCPNIQASRAMIRTTARTMDETMATTQPTWRFGRVAGGNPPRRFVEETGPLRAE